MGLSHALEAVAMPTTMDSLEQKDSNEWQELVEVQEKKEEPEEEPEEGEGHNSCSKEKYKVCNWQIYYLGLMAISIFASD